MALYIHNSRERGQAGAEASFDKLLAGASSGSQHPDYDRHDGTGEDDREATDAGRRSLCASREEGGRRLVYRPVRMAHPGSSSDAGGYITMITMPALPWEQAQTREEATEAARKSGHYIRGGRKT